MTNKVIILILMNRGAITRRTSKFQGLRQVSICFNHMAKHPWLVFLLQKHMNVICNCFDVICPNLNSMSSFPTVQQRKKDRWPLTKKVQNDDV